VKHEPKYPNRHVGRLADHADHEGWTQTGHCVWCGCGFRLFNGRFLAADATVDAKREVLEMLDAALDAAAAKRRDAEGEP
jgi:hypothetical protein